MIADYYYYNLLNAKEQELYKAIYNGIKSHKKVITMPNCHYDEKQGPEVFNALVEDNPHLFYLDQRQMSIGQRVDGSDIFINYYFEEDVCLSYTQKVNEYVNAIINQSGANRLKSDYDKVKAIYDLLVAKGEYDHSDYEKDEHDLAFNHTVLGLLLEKKAVCEGIAKTFKLILNALDIKCIVASGLACREGNKKVYSEQHSWNIVKIDNESYHFDLTWAIEDSKTGDINYDYFGLTDEQIARDHWNYANVPKCNSIKANYFDRNGLVAHNKNELEKLIANSVNKKPVELHVRLDYNCDLVKIAEQVQKKMSELLVNDFCQIIVHVGMREGQKIIHVTTEEIII